MRPRISTRRNSDTSCRYCRHTFTRLQQPQHPLKQRRILLIKARNERSAIPLTGPDALDRPT
ncbi:MAG: hypothetical protein EI684_00025 [Candidatus Viridilinea halotolerans]|uniref:Uncharacterized protein n=1 Tax=Candidatus Viridilinea halotolerans TaxID=2491704 RepID=A0A426UCN1_9CHLR|nr:MAG: hypothetical protein EI684_00025 [Candidatus Viridilinea halotolerans]